MKIKLIKILKISLKLTLPEECSEELLEFYLKHFEIGFNEVFLKTKKILKIKK